MNSDSIDNRSGATKGSGFNFLDADMKRAGETMLLAQALYDAHTCPICESMTDWAECTVFDDLHANAVAAELDWMENHDRDWRAGRRV
jgi:hypothetical protein